MTVFSIEQLKLIFSLYVYVYFENGNILSTFPYL